MKQQSWNGYHISSMIRRRFTISHRATPFPWDLKRRRFSATTMMKVRRAIVVTAIPQMWLLQSPENRDRRERRRLKGHRRGREEYGGAATAHRRRRRNGEQDRWGRRHSATRAVWGSSRVGWCRNTDPPRAPRSCCLSTRTLTGKSWSSVVRRSWSATNNSRSSSSKISAIFTSKISKCADVSIVGALFCFVFCFWFYILLLY